ncbi:hypothetical protein ACFOYU_05500 [Microvirga sp. GCM10011540]|uniref:hypothetical protein n=1 Tax=Microvirga sp. GCM10011540 TaxID=3317338 RepID=UPI00361C0B12
MKGIFTALATIMRAVARAMRTTLHWCTKTSTWIAETTMDAAAWTAEKTVDLTTAAVDTGVAAVRAPGVLLSSLVGGGVAMPAPVAQEAAHERRMQDVGAAVEALQQRRKAIQSQELMRPQDLIGEIVYRFASATGRERYDVDLEMLPPHIRSWLLSRDESTLQRLAAAGPAKCGLVGSGRRSGLVGIDGPEAPELDPEPVMKRAAIEPYMQNSTRVGRIAAAKALRNPTFTMN